MLAWVHDLSPFVVRFTESFGIRWYGLSYIASFVAAYFMLKFLSRRGYLRTPEARIFDMMVVCVMGVVVGGRLGYVLFYQRSLLWTWLDHAPWWGVLAINEGGMASHGGMIGVIVGAYVISRGWKGENGTRVGRVPMLHVLDALALVTPPGLMLGRLANFVNGELLGKIAAMPGEKAPWWAVKFPQELEFPRVAVEATSPRPVLTPGQEEQLEAVLAPFRNLAGGSEAGGVKRMIEAIQGGAHDVAARLEPLLSARHPSQLYQAFAEGIVVGVVVWWVARKPRLPGMVGGTFMVTYGVLRIITEFWRLPDAHLEHQRILGFSRGQWLSVAMVAICGTAMVAVARRGRGTKMGGWMYPAPAAGAEGPAPRAGR